LWQRQDAPGYWATKIAGLDLGLRPRNYIIHTKEGSECNWIDRIVRRNCLLEHFTERNLEERIKLMEIRGRRHKQMMDDLEEREDTEN